jgi:hypothetical protein
MIYLITGLPGNGKTLYTLWHVKERAEKEGRAVFYSGIPELKISTWQELKEAEKWHELPDGSIIVIDEAQRIFRPRQGRGGEPPEHVALLETHRHKGYDIYIITQHPSLIDMNVRRLAGTHRHVQRTFGAARAVIHEWGEVHLDCERRRNDSSKTIWKYPKNIYSLYKSAEVHTHRIQLPKHIWYLLICIILLLGSGIFIKTRVSARTATAPKETGSAAAAEVANSDSFLNVQKSVEKTPMTTDQYRHSFLPRISGQKHTAPRYDDLTKPAVVPVIAGCVMHGEKCRCYNQQGTRYPATLAICKEVALGNTPFYDFIPSPGEAPGTRSGHADAPGTESSN